MNHSTTTARINTINGGAPFAWIAFDKLDGLKGTDKFVLCCIHATARYQNPGAGQGAIELQTPVGGWPAWLGLPERTVYRSLDRLIDESLLYRGDTSSRRNTWELDESILESRDREAEHRNIDIKTMTRPGWTPAMRSAWIALCYYARLPDKPTCYPSQDNLARRAGMNRTNLNRAISRIRDDGCLTIKRRRGASIYHLLTTAKNGTSGLPKTAQDPAKNGTRPLPKTHTTTAKNGTREVKSLSRALNKAFKGSYRMAPLAQARPEDSSSRDDDIERRKRQAALAAQGCTLDEIKQQTGT